MTILRKFKNEVEELKLDRFKRIYVGYSGGADSTALLLMLQALNFNIKAVHLNHQLRTDALDDANWTEEFCRTRNIPYECHTLNIDLSNSDGMENSARMKRLEFWRNYVKGNSAVALGHHADDCLENLLLRLTRGSNVSGLTSPLLIDNIHGVTYVRPCLNLRRSEIEEYLFENGVKNWCHDYTNDDTTIRRNAVRHKWLPSILKTIGNDDGLIQSLKVLRYDSMYINECVDAVDIVNLSPQELRVLHPALLPRVLRKWLAREAGKEIILRHEAISRISAHLLELPEKPVNIPLFKNYHLRLSHTNMSVYKKRAALNDFLWDWSRIFSVNMDDLELNSEVAVYESDSVQSKNEVWFDLDAIANKIEIRSVRTGDKMIPYGSKSARKLKKLFADAGIHADLRQGVPILLSGDTIIWIPGVRRSTFALAEPGKKALHLTYKEN